jgi:hypothetical protein
MIASGAWAARMRSSAAVADVGVLEGVERALRHRRHVFEAAA